MQPKLELLVQDPTQLSAFKIKCHNPLFTPSSQHSVCSSTSQVICHFFFFLICCVWFWILLCMIHLNVHGWMYLYFLAKKSMLQYAHNSKEKKDYEGAKSGGFFVGKEIPDSDSSEEGEYCILYNWLRLRWRRYHWLMNDVQNLISHSQNLNQSWSKNNVSSLSSSLANSTNTTISIILFLETSKSG